MWVKINVTGGKMRRELKRSDRSGPFCCRSERALGSLSDVGRLHDGETATATNTTSQ
jgi:hypothetical protein